MLGVFKDTAVYAITFTLTLFFCIIADKALQKKRRKEFFASSAIALLIPCLLAGVRAETVGTDIGVYAKPLFDSLCSSGFAGIGTQGVSLEYGYEFMAATVATLTQSFPVFLSVSQLAVILPIYMVACKRSRETPIWFTMAIYLLVFYCASFNLMRQCISGALALLAFQYFEEKSYIKSILCIAIGMLFHNSILIGVAIYACAYSIKLIRQNSIQRLMIVLIVLVVVVVYSQWYNILSMLIEIGILPEKYSTYLSIFTGDYFAYQSYYFELTYSNYIECAYRIWFALLGFVFTYRTLRRRSQQNAGVYMTTMIICALINLLTMVVLHSSYGIRIVWNNEFILLLLLPSLFQCNSRSIKKATPRMFVIEMSILSYFLLGYVLLGWHGVRPFEFAI